jgi:hypothetical protein
MWFIMAFKTHFQTVEERVCVFFIHYCGIFGVVQYLVFHILKIKCEYCVVQFKIHNYCICIGMVPCLQLKFHTLSLVI